MKKVTFYTEIAYIVAIIIMAFGAALMAKSDFGVSMIVAPAYILHLVLSRVLPWFSFGVAEYVLQGVLVLLTVIIMRKFKLSYLFSFVTAIIYGTMLDIAIYLIADLATNTIAIRILWYSLGFLFCAFAVSMFFRSYISPEAYELFVKELSKKLNCDINRVKVIYDISSLVVAIAMSFIFFGFGVFEGVKIGTVICAVLNGFLISVCTKILNKFFEFKNGFKFQSWFE